ncbi:hypothetical protein BS17DRAFT_775580 [Gyrodon lividus]|nr:hypothetical protein BS17DRAFT_775580 [Gyrodon lividus]
MAPKLRPLSTQMSPWAQSTHHPWFNPPANAMKRRLSTTGHDHDQQLSEYPNGRLKRPKYNTLEHGFAHMMLSNGLSFIPTDPPSAYTDSKVVDILAKAHPAPHPAPSHHPCTFETFHVILPGSVEEPAPPVSQTDMEVEPDSLATNICVATEPSHASDDPEDTNSEQLEIQEVEISPVVLERLKKKTKSLPPLIPIYSPASQALVLFRPLRPPSPKFTREAVLGDDERREPTRVATPLTPESDAMDVE